jgi:hypothetical protein
LALKGICNDTMIVNARWVGSGADHDARWQVTSYIPCFGSRWLHISAATLLCSCHPSSWWCIIGHLAIVLW